MHILKYKLEAVQTRDRAFRPELFGDGDHATAMLLTAYKVHDTARDWANRFWPDDPQDTATCAHILSSWWRIALDVGLDPVKDGLELTIWNATGNDRREPECEVGKIMMKNRDAVFRSGRDGPNQIIIQATLVNSIYQTLSKYESSKTLKTTKTETTSP